MARRTQHSLTVFLCEPGFSRVTEPMGGLYIVKEFVDNLQSAVQLPTLVSRSCEWKSKDLTVAQSHSASSLRREREGERERGREGDSLSSSNLM